MNTLNCRPVGLLNIHACCCLLCLTVAPQTFGDLVGVVAEIRTDLPICQDTNQDFIDEPLAVCGLYIVFDDPANRLLGISNADITTSDPDGFYQHPGGGNSPTAPACDDITAPPPFGFPDLICDSFITIGVECGEIDPADGTAPDGDFVFFEFAQNGHVVGGWFNANPVNGQGDAGTYPDLRVLVAQFSMAEAYSTYGDLNVAFTGPSGTPPINPHKMFDCRAGACLGSACPADVDRDGAVGAFDLATLLGSWGPCDNGPCRCVDADDDGNVGPADLAQLLGNWGPCP